MNVSSIFRRIILGAALALTMGSMAVATVGAQQPDGGTIRTPGQTSIVTDKDTYAIGDPITVTYTLPGPGFYRITDHQGERVSTLRSGFTNQTSGRIAGTVSPPTGKECLKLEYRNSRNQASVAETCFEVTTKATPGEQMIMPGIYTLRNRGSGFMLDSNPEKRVYPHAPNDGAFQKWVLETAPDGHFFLRDLATSYYLDSNPMGHVYTHEKNLGIYQQWKLEAAPEGHFILRNRATSLMLADSSEAIFAGDPTVGALSDPKFQWKLTAVQP